MMMNDVILKLISEATTVDQYGDLVKAKTERTVFAEERSIGQSEFYQAAATGLRPEVKFILSDYLDYAGEKMVKYKPFQGEEQIYTVIRTYRKDETLEIVCRRGID